MSQPPVREPTPVRLVGVRGTVSLGLPHCRLDGNVRCRIVLPPWGMLSIIDFRGLALLADWAARGAPV